MTTRVERGTPLYPSERALLRQVFAEARRKGWTRIHYVNSTSVAEWDKDGSLIALERFSDGLVLDLCGMTRIDVVSLTYAVDILVAASVLPAHLSSIHATGYEQGRESLWHDVRFCAQLGEADDSDTLVTETITNGRTIALSALHREDVRAELDRLLDPLLDKHPYARRGQVETVIDAVIEVLER